MGGLVFREILLADTARGPVEGLGLASKLSSPGGHGGLIYLGVPMDGSYMAAIIRYFFRTTHLSNLANNPDFDAEANYVDGLRQRWHDGPAVLHGIGTQCAYETEPEGFLRPWHLVVETVGLGDYGLIVPPQSVEPFCGPFQALPFKHTALTKPFDAGDPRLDFIRSAYLALNPDLNDALATMTPEEDGYSQPDGVSPDVVQVYCAKDRYEGDNRALSSFLATTVFASRPDLIRVRSARQYRAWAEEGANDAGYVRSIWGSHPDPKIVSVHWSCFEATVEDDEAVKASTRIFLAFASSMKQRDVKLLIYSQAKPDDIRYQLNTVDLSDTGTEPDFCMVAMIEGWDAVEDLPLRFGAAIDALLGKGACPHPVTLQASRPHPRP